MAQTNFSDDVPITPWDYARLVRRVDPREARLARGFLRSKPEKWFPGFATHWLPLAHSIGLDAKVVDVRPFVAASAGQDIGFSGSVDGEPMAIMLDRESARNLQELLIPGAAENAAGIVLEYLARRFFTSLALSWTGPESSVVQYEPETDARQVRPYASVKVVTNINGAAISINIAMGKLLVEKLDGLWRRQIQSSSKAAPANEEVRVECAQLAVPPAMLSEYMRSGTIIDLEVPVSDAVVLRSGGRVWMAGKMCNVSENLGLELSPAPPVPPGVPEGTTRLAIEFGTIALNYASLSELSQAGAVLETEIKLSDRVHMVINGERVGGATLCSYEGRFAIVVD